MKQCIIFVLCCGLSCTFGEEDFCDGAPCCFQFRWLGPLYSTSDKLNCTGQKGVPCIWPLINTTDISPPNTTEIWENRLDEGKDKLCVQTPGNVCVTYTFMYDDAIVNTSRYCGKVIEDKISAVTSGCYSQWLDGYIIEVCACESIAGMVPCNSSNETVHSSMASVFLLFFASLVYFK